MRYMGGKFRLAKWIVPDLIQVMADHDCLHFADLFCGAVNIVGNMPATGRRLGNDLHSDLIALWRAVQSGWTPPKTLSRGKYTRLQATRGQAPDPLRAFAGFGCSYRGKYFGGYDENGAKQAHNSIAIKRPLITGVEFSCLDYRDVPIPPRTLIYCDIPYQGTAGYGSCLDHAAFWAWATETSRTTPIVVSEYARNSHGRRILAQRASTCFMSNKHAIPTQDALILLSPRD